MRNFFASLGRVLSNLFSQIADGFKWVLRDGKWVFERVRAPAVEIASSVGGAGMWAWDHVAAPALDVALSLPGAAARMLLPGPAPEVVDQAAQSREVAAEVEQRVEQRVAARLPSFAQAAKAMALTITSGSKPPETAHLKMRHQVWLASMTPQTALAVLKMSDATLEDFGRGGKTIRLLQPLPDRNATLAVVEAVAEQEFEASNIVSLPLRRAG